MFELCFCPLWQKSLHPHPWTETWPETHKGCIVQASAINRGSVKPKWRMIVLQEAAMRQEKASSFLECDNGDQQLYLWCWKKAKFICSLSRGQYWAVHRAGAGLEGQWEPQCTLRAGVQAVSPLPPTSVVPTSLYLCPCIVSSHTKSYRHLSQSRMVE